MANKSIGSLYIDILARTESLEKDFAKIKAQMQDLADSTTKAGKASSDAYKSFQLWNSFQGRGMTGIVFDMMALMTVLNAVKKEFAYVYENIDKIHGMDPEAVQSVTEFKVAWHGVKEGIDQTIGSFMKWIAITGKAIGTGAGMLLTGNMGYTPPLELPSKDDIARATDPGYDAKIDAARTKLLEQKKQTAMAEMFGAQKEAALRDEALAIEKTINANHNTVENLTAELNMEQKLQQAKEIRLTLEKRLVTYQRESNVEQTQWRLQEMSQTQRVVELKRMLQEKLIGTGMFAAGGNPSNMPNFDRMTTDQMQVIHDRFPEILKYWTMLRGEYAKIKTANEEMRDAFVSGFKEMAGVARQFVTGMDTDFNKVLKGIADKIIDTFMELAFINPLMNMMFGSSKGFSILPTLFGGAPGKAVGGPGSGWTMVGEQGPELVNLSGGSNVIPAAQTRNMLGRGGGGNVYQIDARGADPAVLPQLQQLILTLAGPGVVEQRALSATQNSMWRARR